MAIEHIFTRLAVRQSVVCQQCRRSFVSSANTRQQSQSATASFMDSFENSRAQSALQSRKPASSQTPSSTPSPWRKFAESSLLSVTAASREQKNRAALADLQRTFSREDLDRQAVRKWKPGDVYAPHDLSGTEMSKWKKIRKKPKTKYDVLDQLGINPLHHYKNFSMMSEYVSEMGRIRHSNDTGLRPVDQRKMAKAVRRAMGIGLIPGVYRHPEILKLDTPKRQM